MAAQTKFTRRERAIASTLGLTTAGLSLLSRSYSSPHIASGGVAADALIRKGLIGKGGEMTPEARQIVERARQLGW